jgi:hypothetical protein
MKKFRNDFFLSRWNGEIMHRRVELWTTSISQKSLAVSFEAAADAAPTSSEWNNEILINFSCSS